MVKFAMLALCVVMVLGCSEQSRGRKQRETTHPTLEGTRWMLQSIKGRPTNSDGPAAYLELQEKDLRFVGNSGLNAISGTYQRGSEHSLRFTLGISTKLAGSDEAMEQERDLLQALSLTENYRIEGRELSLLVDNGVVAFFVAQ